MSAETAPEHVRWAVDCLVEELDVERAEAELQERFASDNERVQAALAYLRREYGQGVTA